MEEQYRVPVVLIVFNRISLVEKLLKILADIRPEKLFVISDGARPYVKGETEKVEQVRRLFEHLPWPCKVFRNYAEENMGCDRRVPSGLDWVFEHTDRAVILEDDCMPSGQFFQYAENMLDKYQDDPKVMMIAGSNMIPEYEITDSCCFTVRTYTWGWATWRRAWACYCDDEKEWKRIQEDGTLAKIYPLRSRYYLKKELNYYFKRGKCPWDYLWWISCMGCGGLCAVPKVNLISNEGFGEDATHTKEKGAYSGRVEELIFPLHYPEEVKRDKKYERLDRGLNPPWKIVRLYRKIWRKICR